MNETQAEVWVLVDSCGDTAVGSTADEAKEHYEENVQAVGDCEGFRLVKVLVTVPLPEVSTVELTAGAASLGEPSAE